MYVLKRTHEKGLKFSQVDTCVVIIFFFFCVDQGVLGSSHMKKLPCLMNARLTDHTKLMVEKLKLREPCHVRYTQNMFCIMHVHE